MQIVIDIPKKSYEDIRRADVLHPIFKAIKNGTPLTDCTDAISRKAAIEVVGDTLGHLNSCGCNSYIKIGTKCANAIRNLPSVNPTTDLSKIRAEIEEELVQDDWDIGNEYIYNNAIRDVLDIIDKYSKGGESDA